MKRDLMKIAIRNKAIYLENRTSTEFKELNETTLVLLANCTKLGFNFSEEALNTINSISPKEKLELLEILKEVTGVNKNWTPLVKQWDVPTGESIKDHVMTFFANLFNTKKGSEMPCGHIIPLGTFPIERYNGCPYCGTPFEFDQLDYTLNSNKLKTLDLWTNEDAKLYLISLLESPVALDATQIDSLKVLLSEIDLPEAIEISMKETTMVVIDALVSVGKEKDARKFFKTPTDVLRYLWYKHTGLLQVIEPKVIAERMRKNAQNRHYQLDKASEAKIKSLTDLKLKYSRTEARVYANWLNSLPLSAEAMCENMHSKRSMWVRFIRALRLTEFAKQKGFENLTNVLDVFYNETYEVWNGKVMTSRIKFDADATFELLKQKPGMFARSLFSTMLWFGQDATIHAFKEVIDQVPARLIFTLNMYAENYFQRNASRTVKPLGGTSKRIAGNNLIQLYSDEDLIRMQKLVEDLCLDVMKLKFEKEKTQNKTIFIHPSLFNIPIAIGDRSETIQDLPSALMGTKFKLEGEKVRLFMQWGEGLPAQHLDMDLSCSIAYASRVDYCSFSNLVTTGCKHSGDIRSIPNKVGTAEYIELDLNELSKNNAQYVTFTCNAYSNGSITPNLVVGWMNSAFQMKIKSSGVAYNPSAVQHQVRISKGLAKGLVFGILDVKKREIIWLEMSFQGQIVQNLDTKGVESLLAKLNSKLKIGDLLLMKAMVQDLQVLEHPYLADESYDEKWVLNSAEVAKFFLD